MSNLFNFLGAMALACAAAAAGAAFSHARLAPPAPAVDAAASQSPGQEYGAAGDDDELHHGKAW